MLICTLDGKKGYPSTKNNIKVTLENPFVKDSGTYSYDIIFPMEIDANRRLFANVHRLDVKKTATTFEQCLLYVDNRLVMQGKGIITAITNDTVKVQIVGGKSRIKYNSKFENHYIDEIDYPRVVPTCGFNDRVVGNSSTFGHPDIKGGGITAISLTESNFVGQPGVAAFNPIWDETNDTCSNGICVDYFSYLGVRPKGVDENCLGAFMYNLAVQPYLMYVLRKVIEHEGYTLQRNDYDVEPWNRLVIASARKSVRIKDALPHWTVYRFFDEIRKFFNATFLFDEEQKTVSIIDSNDLLNNDSVHYPCRDEFSTDYAQDGLKSLVSSNLRYKFGDSSERSWRDCIPQEVIKSFNVKEYVDFDALSKKEKLTTIMSNFGLYYIYADVVDEKNPDRNEMVGRVTSCGFFNPLVRDDKSGEFMELSIIPVAVVMKKLSHDNEWIKKYDRLYECTWDYYYPIPSVSNVKESGLKDMEKDDDGDYYLSVQKALEEGIDKEEEEKTQDDVMCVMFQAKKIYNRSVIGFPFLPSATSDKGREYARCPITYTDWRMYMRYPGMPSNDDGDSGSLSLQPSLGLDFPSFANAPKTKTLGDFCSNVHVDAHHTIVIKFLTDDVPDPRKIYVFENKRFICQKIEINVSDDGIDKEKTGYFSELL